MTIDDVEIESFSGPRVCDLAGVTYRQLDYWCRTGLVEPSVRPATGSGVHRRFSRDDVLLVAALGQLEIAPTLRRPFADAIRNAGGMGPARWIVLEGNWSVTICTTEDQLKAALRDAVGFVRLVDVEKLVEFDDA